MRISIPLIISTIFLFSCSASRQTDNELRRAEHLMWAHPDSSLVILQEMDRSSLHTNAERARHALLLSQALDRNGIMVKSDSIITPALDYYRYHGTPEDNLRSCYYAATIANNAGDTEAAMEWLARGEAVLPQAEDLYTAGHLYSLKSQLYKYTMDYEAALENDLKASAYFKENQYLPKYASSQASLADDYVNLGDIPSAGQALDDLVPYWDSLGLAVRSQYLKSRIDVAAALKDTANLQALKDSCFTEIPNSGMRPWLAISDAYAASGKVDSALLVLGYYASYHPDDLNVDYYLRLSQIYENEGDFQKAVEMHKKGKEAGDKQLKRALNSDTRFMEERYKSQLVQLRQAHIRAMLIGAIVILLMLGWGIIHFGRKALERIQLSFSSLKQKSDELQRERDALEAAHRESEMMNEETRRIVGERLAVLDKVLLGHITSNPVDSKAANQSIQELLSNRDEFLLSTARVFSASHPKFIAFLKEHNLTQWEVGYCCLFLMGLYSKDIEPHFSRASSNTNNNIIRNKLGLPLNGQKLKTYLLETCKKLES